MLSAVGGQSRRGGGSSTADYGAQPPELPGQGPEFFGSLPVFKLTRGQSAALFAEELLSLRSDETRGLVDIGDVREFRVDVPAPQLEA